MREHKNPFNENSRSSELSNRSRQRDSQVKKLQKIPKKSLSAVFGSQEDGLKESVDFSSVSEVVDSNDDCSDVAESLLLPLTPAQSTTTDMFDSSELSQSLSYEANQLENLNQSFHKAEMLLDKTTKARLDDSYTLPPHEIDYFDKMVSVRSRVVHICFALWVTAIFGIIFSSSQSQGFYIGPLPT